MHDSETVSTLQSDGVLSIVETTSGEVWLGTDGGGIVAVDTRSGSTRRIRHHADTPTSLSDDEILALYRDRSGLVWAATSTATSTMTRSNTLSSRCSAQQDDRTASATKMCTSNPDLS